MSEKRKPTILVVDDDSGIRKSIKLVLRRSGAKLLEANNGVEALQIIRNIAATEGSIDLVLTDTQMPTMNGITLTRTINRDFPGTPVIAMSGNQIAGDYEGLEIHDFIAKPFTPDALRNSVKAALVSTDPKQAVTASTHSEDS